MVNSGSIVVNALLQNLMQPDMSGAEKFDYLNDYIKVKYSVIQNAGISKTIHYGEGQ